MTKIYHVYDHALARSVYFQKIDDAKEWIIKIKERSSDDFSEEDFDLYEENLRTSPNINADDRSIY